MKNRSVIIEEFMEMSSRCAFKLEDDSRYEGYILEIEDGHLIFTKESPSNPRELTLIPIREINLNTLSIWDKDDNQGNVRWDEDESEWKYKISGQDSEWQKLIFAPKGFLH